VFIGWVALDLKEIDSFGLGYLSSYLVEKWALREAVLNAILHNDYLFMTSPVFEIYDDRIVVLSSGGLPAGLSREDFFKGRSLPRSQELMRIFTDMKLCERLGTGMQKILRAYPTDIFDISDSFIQASFPYNSEALAILRNRIPEEATERAAYAASLLSANALRVLALLKEEGAKTVEEIDGALDLSSGDAVIELRGHGLIKKDASQRYSVK